ncbi:MAG: GntR family transcriptional regulator [Clostridia bacterium]|nr:GntR family transcriptional regulator [Clostridia bacterium]
MDISFAIDREAKRAAYRQIMSGITAMVRDGQLVPGDKLPSERELALLLGTARGTVKKAYDRLCTNGVAQSAVGSGTFISMGQDVITTNRKQQAVKSIEALADELIGQGFSHREIETHFNLVMNKYKSREGIVSIAVVDCSPEALYTFEQQLGYIPGISMEKVLLEALRKERSPSDMLSPYDLIVTTQTHYDELCELMPRLSGKIMQVVLSPDRQTVIELAQIPKDRQVGSICISEIYMNVISRFMTRDIQPRNKLIAGGPGSVRNEFLKDKDYLILPPQHVVENAGGFELDDFKRRGGRIIYFNYQIERGSLIHIEERISSILKARSGRDYE